MLDAGYWILVASIQYLESSIQKTIKMKYHLFLLLLLLACTPQKSEDITTVEKLKLEDIQLENLDGKAVDLKQFKGKTIFINFWATWCKPCLQEMPSIEKAMQQFENGEVVFLFPSNETTEEIIAFKNRRNFPFEYVQVKNLEVLNFYALPATLIFNPEGELIFSEMGMRDWSTPENIAQILNGY